MKNIFLIIFLFASFLSFGNGGTYQITEINHSSVKITAQIEKYWVSGMDDVFQICHKKKGRWKPICNANQTILMSNMYQDLGNGMREFTITNLKPETEYKIIIHLGSSMTAGWGWTNLSGPNKFKTTSEPFSQSTTSGSFGGDIWFNGTKAIHIPVVGDYNNDGFDDIAYFGKCGSGTECWRVHLNNQNGGFTVTSFGTDVWFQTQDTPSTPLSGDFNNDGFDDIIYYGKCGSGEKCWRVHLNNQNGGFTTTSFGASMWFQSQDPPSTPLCGDFNNDGFDDVIYYGKCGSGDKCWRVHLNNQSGGFTTTSYGTGMWFEDSDPINTPLAGDLNNDGYFDIIYYGKCGNGEQCWRVHLNDQNGQLSATNYGSNMWFKGTKPINKPILVDINNDDFMDLIYLGKCSSGQAAWRAHVNNTNGGFDEIICFNNSSWFKSNSYNSIPVTGNFKHGNKTHILYFGKCGSGNECWRFEELSF